MPDAAIAKTEFEGSQGARLAAALELPSGRPRAFALFAHCFSCTKDIKAARAIARALRAEGFAVLRFDFTGLGSSEGDFANTNFSSNVDDLIRAADFLRREFEAPSILIGHSLGGAAAIVAAREIAEVKGVATIAAPAESAHLLAHIGAARAEIEEKGEAEISLAGRAFTIKKQLLDDLDRGRVIEAAGALGKPLLLLHSPLDRIVGIENATKLFLAAKHPKSFVSLDEADHLLSNEEDARYAASVIAAWAGRYLGAAGETKPLQKSEAAPAFEGGARAVSIASKRYAVALSIDGHPFVIDAKREDGGDGLGPDPSRTLEAALAACAAITMRMYAERKNWPLEKVTVDVRRGPGEDAHVAAMLEKKVTLEGPLDAAQRERIREIGDKCPVHRMLTAGLKIESQLA